VSQLKRGGPVRNVVTRLQVKSDEIKLTPFYADRIQFDVETCILAVSEDLSIFRQSASIDRFRSVRNSDRAK